MSRTRPTEFDLEQLEYPCGYCGALPGVWCTINGLSEPANFLHADRYNKAREQRSKKMTMAPDNIELTDEERARGWAFREAKFGVAPPFALYSSDGELRCFVGKDELAGLEGAVRKQQIKPGEESDAAFETCTELFYEMDRATLRSLAYEALLISDGPDKIEGDVTNAAVEAQYSVHELTDGTVHAFKVYRQQ